MMRKSLFGLTIALTILTFGMWGTSASAADSGRSASPMQQLAGTILADIGQATWVAEGKGPHVVYVFFDPNCPYCHKLFEDARPWVKQGKLQLRWIPVGILVATSHGKAAAILGAKDPLKAFYQNEEHYSRGGGIEEDIATPEIEKKLHANEQLLARTQLGAVPLMLYHTDTGAAMLVQGSPPKARLAELFKHVK